MTKSISSFLVDLPTPSSISYMWNFGSLLGVFLLMQIFSGMFLAFQFSGEMGISFFSVIHIMRDVNSGWMIRVLHSNGASVFFLFLYIHMGRGIYYGSYSLYSVWMSGVTIFLLSMGTAFLGYVLPWGQMSFWAATVITNLLSAIPYFGVVLVEWIWGGYAVGNSTLIRFFSFHFVFPFIIMAMVMVHLVFLHEKGSSNPVGVLKSVDKVPFHPFFSSKDLLGLVVFMMILILISLLSPYLMMDSENFLMSNPLVTPVHIQPEWYFLFAYTILRSISSKMGGVIALFMSVTIFYVFPFFLKKGIGVKSFSGVGKTVFWMMVVNWMLLTWIGACLVEYPYMEMGQVFSFNYFFLMMLFFVKIGD